MNPFDIFVLIHKNGDRECLTSSSDKMFTKNRNKAESFGILFDIAIISDESIDMTVRTLVYKEK